MKRIFLLINTLFCFAAIQNAAQLQNDSPRHSNTLPAVQASVNPFIPMTNKPYAEYADSLENYYDESALKQNDPEWAAQIALQMREAAQVSGDKRWELEASFFELLYNYYHNWDKPARLKYSEKTLDAVKKIISLAAKSGYTALQLRGEFFIFTHYWYDLENHEMAFRQWNKLEKVLNPVPAEEFLLKPYYYQRIGVLYRFFDEYEKTVFYYKKVLEIPDIARRQGQLEWTINELGLIYRNYYHDLDRADSCFNAILQLISDNRYTKEYPYSAINAQRELWMALAKGNLGTNQYLRGEYDAAIPLLVEGMEGAVKNNTYNYPYATGKALTIAEIFILKNDFSEAGRYARQAREWLDKEQGVSRAHNIDLWQKYYQTLLQYYRAKGDNANAWLYNDSLENAKRIAGEEYNLRQLQHAEQEIRQEELKSEQALSQAYRRNFLISAAFVVIAFILLLFIIYYNRQVAKKNRNLVARLKEQDQMTEMNRQTNTGFDKTADENNAEQLFYTLQAYLLQDKRYAKKIDANNLAAELFVSRTRLFGTVKTLSGKTLQDYINALRLDQARRMLESTVGTIEVIALDCGFLTVRTFYRLFRESYGMTPAQYRKIVWQN